MSRRRPVVTHDPVNGPSSAGRDERQRRSPSGSSRAGVPHTMMTKKRLVLSKKDVARALIVYL